MHDTPCSNRSFPVLHDFPLATRLVLAVFLSSVGVGYLSALVQLHFQGAAAGTPLPGPREVVSIYHGDGKRISQLERLIMTDETRPFSGSGSMRAAFTTKSARWNKLIEQRAKADNVDHVKAEKALRVERGGEAAVLVDWIRRGADPESYEKNAYVLQGELAKIPVTEKYVSEEAGIKQVSIQTILEDRCVRCHSESTSSRANQFPLDKYEQVLEYCEAEPIGGGMSLRKLAQTTHVHLLGFSMLYGLTGFIFSFTRYPCWAKIILAPLPLLAQLVDIGCWWLGRVDPYFAQLILVTGGVVGLSLLAQIVLSIWDMFERNARKVLIVLAILALVSGALLKLRVIDPYLLKESLGSVGTERSAGH